MQQTKIGIAGFGAIGQSLATQILQGMHGIKLSAGGVRIRDTAPDFDWQGNPPPHFATLDPLAPLCDIVIVCAPAELLPTIATPFLNAGKKVITLSSSALLLQPQLIELARAHHGQILVPSGAILGLDALLATAEGTIKSVKMVSRKPPQGFMGAPYVERNNIDLGNLQEPKQLYSGAAREVALGFPANLNVAVSVSLAGIGPDDTSLEVWADPTIAHNTHTVEVVSDTALLTMTIQNVPSNNPKTGRVTANSVIAMLRKIHAPLSIGT